MTSLPLSVLIVVTAVAGALRSLASPLMVGASLTDGSENVIFQGLTDVPSPTTSTLNPPKASSALSIELAPVAVASQAIGDVLRPSKFKTKVPPVTPEFR